MTEKQFQSKILKLAKQLGWTAYHTYDSRRSQPGFPDLVLVKDRVLWRELKTDTGRQTEAQKIWERTLLKAGADFKIWRPKDLETITAELAPRQITETPDKLRVICEQCDTEWHEGEELTPQMLADFARGHARKHRHTVQITARDETK